MQRFLFGDFAEVSSFKVFIAEVNFCIFFWFFNLICKEHALRMLNFALISFLFWSFHFISILVWEPTIPYFTINEYSNFALTLL